MTRFRECHSAACRRGEQVPHPGPNLNHVPGSALASSTRSPMSTLSTKVRVACAIRRIVCRFAVFTPVFMVGPNVVAILPTA